MQSESRFWGDEGMGSISAVVASLPNGATLAEERIHSGVRYKLCYNAGNSQILPGNLAAPVSGGGIASVTVTMASQAGNVGFVVCNHTTATTGTYFWGAFRGVVAGLIGDTVSIPTGNHICVGADGTVQLFNLNSVVSGKMDCGIVITTVSNGGARTGSAYVSFG